MGLLLLQGASDLNPRELFASGEQGLWLDPSQMSTMFTDSAGTTSVTAAGDPVGLILDQSRGGLGAAVEKLSNGTFDTDATGWTAANGTTAVSNGKITITNTAAYGEIYQAFTTVIGRHYACSINLEAITGSGNLLFFIKSDSTSFSSPNRVDIIANGSAVIKQYSAFFVATATTTYIHAVNGSTGVGASVTVDNISVREVPGNHAYQTTSASRPTLARIPSSGRRNLLTRTEEFDQSPWTGGGNRTVTANAGVAPNGTQTADRVVVSASGSVYVSLFATVAVTASTQYTFSFYLNTTTSLAGNTIRIYNVSGGADIVASENCVYGGGWIRQTVTFTTPVGCTSIYIYPVSISVSNQQNNFFEIWGAQLETGSTVSNYQKVVATTDVTESGVSDLWHLVFDGSDDSLVTNSVDFSGTAQMTVIAGMRQAVTPSAENVIVELSAVYVSNNGTFILNTNSSPNIGFAARGTSTGFYTPSATFPSTNVLSCNFDISGAALAQQIVPKINGQLSQSNSFGSLGSGNFGNYQIFIGRRNQATLPFNGHIYQLIIRGKTTPTGKLLEAERFVGKKTGVTGI